MDRMIAVLCSIMLLTGFVGTVDRHDRVTHTPDQCRNWAEPCPPFFVILVDFIGYR